MCLLHMQAKRRSLVASNREMKKKIRKLNEELDETKNSLAESEAKLARSEKLLRIATAQLAGVCMCVHVCVCVCVCVCVPVCVMQLSDTNALELGSYSLALMYPTHPLTHSLMYTLTCTLSH